MRPPTFAGGNELERLSRLSADLYASMRPPTFAGGNVVEARPYRVADHVLQ